MGRARAIRRTRRLGRGVRKFLLGWLLIAGMVGYTLLLGARGAYRWVAGVGRGAADAVRPDAGGAHSEVNSDSNVSRS